MSISATARDPDDAKRLFGEYADILQMYSSDQFAMMQRLQGKRKREDASLRSTLYQEIADEIRAIEFTKE